MIKIDKNLAKNYFSRAWRELAVIAAVLFLDLLSKFLVSSSMNLYDSKTVIPKFFNIYYTKNPVAAFSFDFFGLGDKLGESGMRVFFIIFVSVSVLAFLLFLVFGYKNSFLYRLPLALIIGGAIGNLYDRVVHQAVRDFLQIEYFGGELFGNHYFPTFNLADTAVVCGGILFIVYFIGFYAKEEEQKRLVAAGKKLLAEEKNNAENANDLDNKLAENDSPERAENAEEK